MIKYLLVLPCLFLCFSNVFGQNLLPNSSLELGTLGAGTAPTDWTSTRVDYNDPSSASNDPRVGGTETWIDFDGIAGNNDSQEGARAVGGDHADWMAYDLSSTPYTPGANYTIYYEHSNPGLIDGATTHDGDGFWRFRLAGGSWTSGPVISMNSTGTMQWSIAKVHITAGAGSPNEFRVQVREANSGDAVYLQIDNIILVPECTEDLGSPALNAIYEDLIVCYPETSTAADNKPGTQHINPATCDIEAGDPTEIIMTPTFDCNVATPISFDTPILPSNPKVLYHYWGNCAPLSPEMPEDLPWESNGYIQQMFCDTDAFGLPAWPGGLSDENGTIIFLPQESYDVGCNGFAAVGTCDCGGYGTDETDTELIQIDFWMAIPDSQSQVGFRFSTNTREDAGSFFVGADLNNMCEVAFFTDGRNHDTLPDQLTGTFNIDGQLSRTCGLLWMRVRLYIHDISDHFEVNPQINAGNGWVDIDQLLIEPALTADDNTLPTVGTTTVTGYLIDGKFIYDNEGTWDPYGCNPVTLSMADTGACAPVMDVTLVKFNVRPKKESAVLNWTTASEINSDKFIIERSDGAKSFRSIGEVQSKGTSNKHLDYEFIDARPLIGTSYYRLQEVSLDGSSDYSKIVSVDFTTNSDLVIYPNPASDQLFWKNVNEHLTYKIVNMHGQEVSLGLVKPSNAALDLSTFSSGLYFMTIYNQHNELTQIVKVVID